MENLKKIINLKYRPLSSFQPDIFQRGIKDNLYLEFFLSTCRVLIRPNMSILTTETPLAKEEKNFRKLVAENHKQIEQLKEYLIFQLSLYSSLLETNSYYITLNKHLVICRFVSIYDHPRDFELKLYTIPDEELPQNYKDKIYIGRDFISLEKKDRDHFGLKHIKNSLFEQLEKLKLRYKKFLDPKQLTEIQKEYLDEIAELLIDFATGASKVLDVYPAEINSQTMKRDKLMEVNYLFRQLKHILIDLEGSAREMESNLFKGKHHRAVRYATKFCKDLTNYMNYITFKINGRISDSLNGIHI